MMRPLCRLRRIAGVLVVGGGLAACAQLAGLSDYAPGDTSAQSDAAAGGGSAEGRSDAASPGPDASQDPARDGALAPTPPLDGGDASSGPDGSPGSDAGEAADVAAGSDAGEDIDAEEDSGTCPAATPTPCGGACVDEQSDVSNCGGCGEAFACATGQSCSNGRCLGCGTSCPLSTVGAYSCPAGGCNAAGGACSAAGLGCYCAKDGDCVNGGKCVKIAGQNDTSCASCTGTGAADGFGCALAAPGIPATCTGQSFGYTPSNFQPASYTPPTAGTTINCNTTYSSTTHSFTGWCSGETAPTIYSSVAQPAGGHAVDILAFASLTVGAGSTLTLTGSNPVILAVYGAATIAGVIDASAQSGTPGAGATACAVGASGGGASGPSYTAGTDAGAAGGGGGGLAAGGGSGEFSTYNSSDGGPITGTENAVVAGGSAHGASTAVPLTGGCPGGTGAAGTAGNAGGGGGAGGGGVQISVAGAISGSGTIKANGSAGGTGGSVSPAAAHDDGAGGGGGGSGGDVLIESAASNSLSTQANGGVGGGGGTGYGADTTPANTWPGDPGGGAGTSTGGSTAAPTNGGPPSERGQSYAGGGGGGGGGYGWIRVNIGALPAYSCATTLSPVPVCNAAHSACLCVADSDCSSGRCANTSNQCTGSCTGSGAIDGARCQTLVSEATAWSCAVGDCDTVTAPGGACGAAGVACWCTADTQCASGRCGVWAGCPAGACTGSGAGDGMNCVP